MSKSGIIYIGVDTMIKLATLFSGIGAIEQALRQLELEHEINTTKNAVKENNMINLTLILQQI